MAAASCALVLSAPGAQAAATIVGDNPMTPTGSPETIGAGPNMPVFQGDAASGYVLSSPVDGTVTSWGFLSAGVGPGTTFVLRVLRPADMTGQSWTAVATSAAQPVTGVVGVDTVEGPFTTNLPIKVGDRIALQPTATSDTPLETVQGAGVRYFTNAFADGSTATLAPGSGADNNQLVPVQATVQPTPPPLDGKPPSVLGVPKAGRTLTCDPGTWTGVQTFSYTWFLSTLAGVPSGANRPPHFVHTTFQIASGQTLIAGDYRPGSSTLSCVVTASNAGGSATASSAAVTVQAVPPALAPPLHLGRRTIMSQPQITAGVGVGGTNFCTTGLWWHYPTAYTYVWKLRTARGLKTVGRRQSLAITGGDEGHKLFCVVGASNSAGATGARTNSYTVPRTAPINTGRPVVFGTSTPRPPGTSPPANPGGLNGNSFHVSCAAGRWNRPDLSYTYEWVFDRTPNKQSPPQLTGLWVPGINLAIEIDPPNGPLMINGAPPKINGRIAYGLDYLDDTVECEVTATAPNGLISVALSPPVALRGPVAGL